MGVKKNVSANDSVIRIILGVTLMNAYWLDAGGAQNAWLLLGLIPLVTGLAGTCPTYMLFGRCTSKMRRE